MKTILLAILILFTTSIASAQTTYYVSTTGDNNNDGLTEALAFATISEAADQALHGDTVLVLPGTYTNTGYGGPLDIWNNERTFILNHKTTTTTDILTIKPQTAGTVTLKGDGIIVVQIKNSNNIRFEGFIIEGEANNITFALGRQYQFSYKDENGVLQERVPQGTTDAQVQENYSTLGSLEILASNIKRPTYFNTSGISLNSTHHIEVVNNIVKHMPGEGIRAFKSDFLTITDNIVEDCSSRSSTGVHGLSVYLMKSNADPANINFVGVRNLIARNKVYDNVNEIYSWVGSKTFINPHLDEGKGLTVQRCTPDYFWNEGVIRIENNICYRNGFSGVGVNGGTRLEIINNTVYNNSVSYEQNGEGSQQGISLNHGNDIVIANNIIYSDNPNAVGKALNFSKDTGDDGFITVKNNFVFGGINTKAIAYTGGTNTLNVSPVFVDVANRNFALLTGSPAIDIANTSYAPTNDYFKTIRDANPDIGAIEYSSTLSISEFGLNDINIYPNPFTSKIVIDKILRKEEISIYNVLGQNMTNYISIKNNSQNTEVITTDLPSGMYIIKTKTFANKVYKQ